MSWSLRIAARRPASIAQLFSLYRDWTEIPCSVLDELDPPGFTLAEVEALNAWGEAQRAWGLSVRLRWDHTGTAKLAEVFDLDVGAPIAILYREPEGRLRVDAFSGDMHTCGSLSEAQQRILGNIDRPSAKRL